MARGWFTCFKDFRGVFNLFQHNLGCPMIISTKKRTNFMLHTTNTLTPNLSNPNGHRLTNTTTHAKLVCKLNNSIPITPTLLNRSLFRRRLREKMHHRPQEKHREKHKLTGKTNELHHFHEEPICTDRLTPPLQTKPSKFEQKSRILTSNRTRATLQLQRTPICPILIVSVFFDKRFSSI